MLNPFSRTVIPVGSPICGRQSEIEEIIAFAETGEKAFLYSPRRHGKTTLARHAQATLKQRRPDAITAYCSIDRETTPDGVAKRVAEAMIRAIHERETLVKRFARGAGTFALNWGFSVEFPGMEDIQVAMVKKETASGLDLLEEVSERLSRTVNSVEEPVSIVIDEFQIIADIDPKHKMESVLREAVQHTRAGFLFIGSQRRMLQSIFTDAARPFYRSAHRMTLKPLEVGEMAEYLDREFVRGGGRADRGAALILARLSGGVPYHLQSLAFNAFARGGGVLTRESVRTAFYELVQETRALMEEQLARLTLTQRKTLLLISRQREGSPFQKELLVEHELSSGGVESSLKALTDVDLIEPVPMKPEAKYRAYRMVDHFEKIALMQTEAEVFQAAERGLEEGD